MYLLDANAAITPFHESKLKALAIARRQDPVAVQQYLTKWFLSGFSKAKLLLCPEAKEEILKGKGHASDLVRSVGGTQHMVYHDEISLALLRQVHQFVEDSFEAQHAEAFLREDKADPHLVTIAKARRYCILTEETHAMRDARSDRISGRVTLPYVAFAFGVRCVSLMTALSQHPEW